MGSGNWGNTAERNETLQEHEGGVSCELWGVIFPGKLAMRSVGLQAWHLGHEHFRYLFSSTSTAHFEGSLNIQSLSPWFTSHSCTFEKQWFSLYRRIFYGKIVMSQIQVLNKCLVSKFNLLWREWPNDSFHVCWGRGVQRGVIECSSNLPVKAPSHWWSPQHKCASEHGCQAPSAVSWPLNQDLFLLRKNSWYLCCKMGSHFAQKDTLPSFRRRPALPAYGKSQTPIFQTHLAPGDSQKQGTSICGILCLILLSGTGKW